MTLALYFAGAWCFTLFTAINASYATPPRDAHKVTTFAIFAVCSALWPALCLVAIGVKIRAEVLKWMT